MYTCSCIFKNMCPHVYGDHRTTSAFRVAIHCFGGIPIHMKQMVFFKETGHSIPSRGGVWLPWDFPQQMFHSQTDRIACLAIYCREHTTATRSGRHMSLTIRGKKPYWDHPKVFSLTQISFMCMSQHPLQRQCTYSFPSWLLSAPVCECTIMLCDTIPTEIQTSTHHREGPDDRWM